MEEFVKIKLVKNRLSKIVSRVYELFFYLVLLFPITTLIQGRIDFINRALFVVIFILQLTIIISKINYRSFIFLSVVLICFLFTLINTEVIAFSNSYVYYVNFFIYAMIFILDRNSFIRFIKSNINYIQMIVFLWTVIVIVSMPFETSYYIKEGGESYFGSFAGDIFRLGPSALFISILSALLIVYDEKKYYIIFQLLPIYCGFSGSSRTYLVCILAVFFIALYSLFKRKKHFIISCIPICIAGFIVFLNSSMLTKFLYVFDESQYGDFWYRVTSSRSEIWANILVAYNNLDIFHKIFGGGFGFSNMVANGLYAHNDFIEILALHGIFGEVLYLAGVFLLFKTFCTRNISKLLLVLMCFVWFFNAFMNMFYTYTCAVLSLPFLLAVLDKRERIMRLVRINEKKFI